MWTGSSHWGGWGGGGGRKPETGIIYIVTGMRDRNKHAQYRIHKQSHALDLSEGFEREYSRMMRYIPRET